MNTLTYRGVVDAAAEKKRSPNNLWGYEAVRFGFDLPAAYRSGFIVGFDLHHTDGRQDGDREYALGYIHGVKVRRRIMRSLARRPDRYARDGCIAVHAASLVNRLRYDNARRRRARRMLLESKPENAT